MKRSSKKFRNVNKKSQKKRLIATGMMVCLGTFPIWSNDNVLLTIIPSASKAFGSQSGFDYDFGVGAKLTYRKGDSLDFFLEGDYKKLNIPNVSSVDMLNASVGAGYHFKFNDRCGLNLSAQIGAYMGMKSDGMVTGPSGGLSVSFTYRLNPVVSVEAGATANHYVATPTPMLTDVGASAALTLNLTEAMTNTSRVKVKTNEMLPVFPVLYSWYQKNAFATIGITNQEDSKIEDVTVSFYQSQYMNQPNVCAKIARLESGETIDAELTAFFNERMLDLTEKTDTEASVIIEYTYLGQKKKKEIGMVVPVYGRNSMSWEDDRRAAVFVSSKDPAALWFSKYVSSIVRENARPESFGNTYTGISQNIQYAMGIFETLDQFGLNYVIDPASAYSDNIGGATIDFLQFPYQTLTYRGGDCDDISILVCSLFEAVGIKTGFITIPGHIFIAFDSGMTMKEAGQSMMNTSNIFDLTGDGRAWIPLEITLTDEGFARAWKVGAREWGTTAESDRMFYAMEDCWKLYEPVSVPGASANFTLPDKTVVTRLFQHSMDEWIAKEISPVVQKYQAQLALNDTVELRNELGILYGQYGLFVEADDQFKRARRLGYLPSLLNTANVYFARKQYKIALEWYRQVLEKDPENDLALLGVARCQYELEDFAECDRAFDIVRNKNPALANEYRYLGAFEETVGRGYSLSDRLTLTKWDRGEYVSGIVNDGSLEPLAKNTREDERGFVTSDSNSSDRIDNDSASLLNQLADMTDSSTVLRPDAVVVNDAAYQRVPTDRYASLDDTATLVQELPGLLAQLHLPEANFSNTDPIMVSDYQLIANAGKTDNRSTTEILETANKGSSSTDTIAKVVVEEKPIVESTVKNTTPTTRQTDTRIEERPFTVTNIEEKPATSTTVATTVVANTRIETPTTT
ncbi:MAG: tetratricopeptide repeat protein, partial [Treponema sp.]|nr:tetratricopeptide repeat protein [Treponema sp.]